MIISDFYLFIFTVIILSYEAEFLPGTCTGFVNEGGHVCHCDSRLIFYQDRRRLDNVSKIGKKSKKENVQEVKFTESIISDILV